MDLIYWIIDFVMEHSAAAVGLLVILMSMSSARKKKKKAEAAAAETARRGQTDPHLQPRRPEKPVMNRREVKKSYQQLMSEIEAELEGKPWDTGNVPEVVARKSAEKLEELRHGNEKKYAHPYAVPAKGTVPTVDIPVEKVASAVNEAVTELFSEGRPREKRGTHPLLGSDLVNAVVMAEVLDKPKALRSE